MYWRWLFPVSVPGVWQVCNHPFLMAGVEENTIRDLNLPVSVNHALIDPRVHKLLVESSGKLQVLQALLLPSTYATAVHVYRTAFPRHTICVSIASEIDAFGGVEAPYVCALCCHVVLCVLSCVHVPVCVTQVCLVCVCGVCVVAAAGEVIASTASTEAPSAAVQSVPGRVRHLGGLPARVV